MNRILADDRSEKMLLESHVDLFGVRLMSIESALQKQNYEQAAALCREGMENLRIPEDLGQIKEMESYLLRISEFTGDIGTQRRLLHKKYLSVKEHDQPCFNRLKSLHSDSTWPRLAEELIKQVGISSQTQRIKVAEILWREERWHRLLVFTEQYIHLIKFTEPFLSKLFPKEVLEIHRRSLERYLATHTGRKFYRRLCGELMRIYHHLPGGAIFTEGMIIRFRQEATSKPAFIEELNRLDAELLSE